MDAEEQQQARRCVWGQVTQITNETHYGLPWGVSAALSDFGSPEEQVSAVVRDVFTPLHMQSACKHPLSFYISPLSLSPCIPVVEPFFTLPLHLSLPLQHFGVFLSLPVSIDSLSLMHKNLELFAFVFAAAAGQTENALSLLQVQVARAVSRLCAVSIAVTSSEKPPAAAAATALPEAANLRSMYRTVLMEMQKDFIVPFAFGYEQERPEYTEVLFNLSLLEFKKAIIFAAAKKQLSVVAQETLQAMGTKQSTQTYLYWPCSRFFPLLHVCFPP